MKIFGTPDSRFATYLTAEASRIHIEIRPKTAARESSGVELKVQT